MGLTPKPAKDSLRWSSITPIRRRSAASTRETRPSRTGNHNPGQQSRRFQKSSKNSGCW